MIEAINFFVLDPISKSEKLNINAKNSLNHLSLERIET